MQLVAKAFLWVHITLYRLTNGRRRQVHRRQPDPPAHHHRSADRQAADPTARLCSPRRPLRAVRLQRRLPSPPRLVPQPARDQPGRDPGRTRAPCRQRQSADPTERSQLFPRLVQIYKGYAGYEQKTTRQIRLVVLTPEHRPNMT
jgi:hypothetical protein